jgi:hypothetical protein
MVRLRYGDAPSFLDVSSVISNYTLAGHFAAGGVINSNLTGCGSLEHRHSPGAAY